MIKVVLASNNPGKIREFSELLSHLSIELIPQSDLGIQEINETGLTFIENALLKARHAAMHSHLPAIADDSGLCVDALNGAPGIFSARYAGEHADAKDNIKKLLHELHDVPLAKRQAHFHCALVFMSHEKDPAPLISQGIFPGIILEKSIGENGFGYDPIFYVPSEKKSAAELSSNIKNKISHRGIALQSLIKMLTEKYERIVS